MTDKTKCDVCGGENMKTGKLMGVAALQSINARNAFSGSELHITFCADCGEVVSIKVAEPEKIK